MGEWVSESGGGCIKKERKKERKLIRLILYEVHNRTKIRQATPPVLSGHSYIMPPHPTYFVFICRDTTRVYIVESSRRGRGLGKLVIR